VPWKALLSWHGSHNPGMIRLAANQDWPPRANVAYIHMLLDLHTLDYQGCRDSNQGFRLNNYCLLALWQLHANGFPVERHCQQANYA
jgi:hypothetical protein